MPYFWKIIDASGRSIFQLFENIKENVGKPEITNTQKTYTTTLGKRFHLLHPKHLKFLIVRGRWIVTKIYSYFIFDQERFKRGFILINQPSRQNAKNSVEKGFLNYLTKQILFSIVTLILIAVPLKPFLIKLFKFHILKSVIVSLKNLFPLRQILI